MSDRWDPRVLVVDDDEVCRLVASALLERLGLEVDVAVNGREALQMSASWPYVAIFMDCSMPEVDGYTAARQIAYRDGVSTHPPVIAVTSQSRMVCLAAGMDHHIAKPVRIENLRAVCASLGLLARPDTQASEPADVLAANTSLLEPPGAADARKESQAVERASTFISYATSRLPELWRAANAGDCSALHRIAIDLKKRAVLVGATRVGDLSDRLAAAATAADVLVAAGIEPQLRQALADTTAAISSHLAEGSTAEEPPTETHGSTGSVPAPVASRPESVAPVRVAIADDDPLARFAIEAMLERSDGLALVGAAADVEGIVDLAEIRRPDVVVLDWMMPGGGGAEAARQILNRIPGTRVVALTASASPDAWSEMTRAGARGVLVKGGSADDLVRLISQAVRS